MRRVRQPADRPLGNRGRKGARRCGGSASEHTTRISLYEDKAVTTIGTIIIFAALLIFIVTLTSEKLREHLKLILSMATVFGCLGFGIIFQDRLIEIPIPGVGTVKTATRETVENAKFVKETRDTVAVQSHTIGLIAKRAEDIDRELNQKLLLAEERLQILNDEQKKASDILEIIKSEQDFISLVYRAQSYDVQAFHVLKKLALEGTKFSDEANRVVKDVETRLSNENLWLLVFTPQETKGVYQYSGPFATEEIQEAIDAGFLDSVLDYISGRKFTFFMNHLVEATMAENDLYRQTRIMRTISSIAGEKFYPWNIEQFKEWWNANRKNYNFWPKQIYYNAKSSFESGNYPNALRQFQEVIDFDNGSEKSKALAIACAMEIGNIDLANQLVSSFIYGNSRWQLWATAKIALVTEGT
jgi:hypothetical protein